MMKLFKKVLIVLLIVVVVFAFTKNFIIKTAITTIGSSVLGAPVKVKSFSLSFLRQKMRIKGFEIHNPKGFPKGVLIDIEEVGADLDVGALLGGKLHIPLIIVDLNNMIVIKNADGVMNVDALKVAQAPKDEPSKKKVEKKKEGKKSKPPKLQIDELRLNIGDVIFKDYTKGAEPDVQAFDVGLKDEVFTNITSPEQLAALIMTAAMGKTAIEGVKMYAATALLGVGILPVGVAGVLMSSDSSTDVLSVSFDKVYGVALSFVEAKGNIKSGNKESGLIKAKIDGADISIQLTQEGKNETAIEVSARKIMLPKPKIAGGILYQIKEELK
ncbi:AsmA family protein [Candidatus Omnitrophota bacterium]